MSLSLFWAKTFPLLVLLISHIWGISDASTSIFNVFNCNAVWTENRTHHFPAATTNGCAKCSATTVAYCVYSDTLVTIILLYYLVWIFVVARLLYNAKSPSNCTSYWNCIANCEFLSRFSVPIKHYII